MEKMLLDLQSYFYQILLNIAYSSLKIITCKSKGNSDFFGNVWIITSTLRGLNFRMECLISMN